MRNKGVNRTKKKGKKNFRKKTYSLDDLKKIEGQEYALVEKVYGQGRYLLKCYDKINRLGIRRGKIKKFAKIEMGNLVLVSLREYQNDKCDILHTYTDEDTTKLVDKRFIKRDFINSLVGNEDDNADEDLYNTEDIVNEQDTTIMELPDEIDKDDEINIDDI